MEQNRQWWREKMIEDEEEHEDVDRRKKDSWVQ